MQLSDNPAQDDDELCLSSEYRISAGPLSSAWWALVIATVTHKSILWVNIWVQIMIIFWWNHSLIWCFFYKKQKLEVPWINVTTVLHCSWKNGSHHLKMLWPAKTNKTWIEVDNLLRSNPVFRFDWYIFGGVGSIFYDPVFRQNYRLVPVWPCQLWPRAAELVRGAKMSSSCPIRLSSRPNILIFNPTYFAV